MGSIQNRDQTQAIDIHEEAQVIPPRRVISHGPNRIIGASGVAWIKPGSSQPPDPSFDTVRHQRIAHALLVELKRGDLVPTPLPDHITDPKVFWEHEAIESSKRIERNRILYPDRLSLVDETLFMTPRKRAVVPTYLRARVANLYFSVTDGTMEYVDDKEGTTPEGSGKLRLFRLGGDRPGKPQHRLHLWKPDHP